MIIDHHAWCGDVLKTVIQAPCVFSDVEGCIPANSYDAKSDYTDKYRCIATSDLVSHQHCYTHNRLCPLFSESARSDIETAGLPCTDQSMAGKRLREQGPTSTVFMCHAKRHIEKETKLIIIENVKVRWEPNRLSN